ncbi:cobyric acid synthase [Edwardsiella tarda]
MTLSIMVQGTASDAGKSVLCAGLCRVFSQDGYRVAPFKSQNMALNSGITADGGEMGRAQMMQAEAAGIAPDVRMNPILLKPSSDCQAQVVLMGRVLQDMDAVHYHQYKPQLLEQVAEVYHQLAAQVDIMVLEGAGSPAEINLRDRDIVNMGMAEKVDAPVLLVADIDRGGVFAAIYGTLALLEPQERARVKGVIINKFRGDVSLLTPGLRQIEALTGVPVLGVVPWLDLDLDDEDGVALQRGKYHDETARALDIAVLQLPYMSNFTDFSPLHAQPDVTLRYVTRPEAIGRPDLLILPGSKSTLADLRYLHDSGLTHGLLCAHQDGVPILGICGGYQMLGNQIIDGVESTQAAMPGLGLLDCETRFAQQKTTTQVLAHVAAGLPGPWGNCAGLALTGYEIHMGTTQRGAGCAPFCQLWQRNGEPCAQEDGAISHDGLVMGTYLHGLFDEPRLTRHLLDALRLAKGMAPAEGAELDYHAWRQRQFDALAAALRSHLDLPQIYRLMREHAEEATCSR